MWTAEEIETNLVAFRSTRNEFMPVAMLQFRFPASKVGPLGRGATAAQRTLNPLIQVRILAPQLKPPWMS